MKKIDGNKERDRVVEVELPPEEPCSACGVRGMHFCTGGQRDSTVYAGKRSSRPTGLPWWL